MSLNRRDFVKGALAASALSAAPFGFAKKNVEKTSVIVIGAGLSGLYSALLLKDLGMDVIVLEASNRIGGRVFTARDIETNPEYGASQIGRSYARAISLCSRFNLKLIAENRDLLPMASQIDGQWVNANDWQDSPLNKMVGNERSIQPALTSSQLLSRLNPLNTLTDWLDPKLAAYDVSVLELLKKHGASDEALRLADASGDIRTASALSLLQEKNRGLFDAKFSGADLSKMDRPYGFDNQRQEGKALAMISNIEGGASRLPEAIAAQLGDSVRINKMVGRIDMSNTGANVQCFDGSRYQADFVISAVPNSVLRNIAIYPLLNGAQADAVYNLGYANTTRAYGVIDAPYWEDDGLDPSFFTNGPIQMLWALKKRPGDDKHRFMVVFTEPSASRIDQIPQAQTLQYIQQEIQRIRPSTKGKLRFLTLYAWQHNPFIKGCRHMFKPGQVSRFANNMIIPHERLHFAGEHTRRNDFGMEAALESGERAASEIIMRS